MKHFIIIASLALISCSNKWIVVHKVPSEKVNAYIISNGKESKYLYTEQEAEVGDPAPED